MLLGRESTEKSDKTENLQLESRVRRNNGREAAKEKTKTVSKKAKNRITSETRENPDWKNPKRRNRRSILPSAVCVVTVYAPFISNHS